MFENCLFERGKNFERKNRGVFFILSLFIHIFIAFIIIVYPTLTDNFENNSGRKVKKKERVNKTGLYSKNRNNSIMKSDKKKTKTNYISYDVKEKIKDSINSSDYKYDDYIKLRIKETVLKENIKVVFNEKYRIKLKIGDNIKIFQYVFRVNINQNGNIGKAELIAGDPILSAIIFNKIKKIKFKVISNDKKKTITFDIIADVQIDNGYYMFIKTIYIFIKSKIRLLKELLHSLIIVFT